LYSSPNVIGLMYSRNMKRAENVARKRQVIWAYCMEQSYTLRTTYPSRQEIPRHFTEPGTRCSVIGL